jgi:hypothetical protein
MAAADILIVTVVWGDWHLGAYLDVNLPTLLAPGNFPALFARHAGRYQIHTRPADVARLRGDPAFQRLSALVPTEIRLIEDAAKLADPIATHVEIWTDAIAEAKAQGRFALLMPPDVLWSDGSFGHVADLLAEGKYAIHAALPRVTANTFLPAFRARFDPRAGAIALSGGALMTLALEHLHPLMAAYSRTSRYFPYHGEMMIWPVAGEGLAVRSFAREPLIYDPGRIRLNEAQLIADPIPSDRFHMIADSDRLLGLSLAPLGKDVAWHCAPWRASTAELARWWLDYDSPANDGVGGVTVRWHTGPVSEDRWRSRERGAALFTRRAALEREALRVARHLFAESTGRALQSGMLLALGSFTRRVARALRGLPRRRTGSVFVFVPEDDVRDGRWSAIGIALAARVDGRLERLVREHVAIADAPGLDDPEALGDLDLAFLSGTRRRLARAGTTRTIDGMPISRMERVSANVVVCYTPDVLGAGRDLLPAVPDGGDAGRAAIATAHG